MRQLRAFVALVDGGSVTAAAHALGFAQSTVSEALASLERVFGTRLLHRRRGAHAMALSAAGATLLPHARGVLAALDAAHAAVTAVAADARAAVDIVANESVSTYLLPPVLAPLRARWPNTRFAVSVATCPGVRAGVARGAYHVGLLLQPADELVVRPAPPGRPEPHASGDANGVRRHTVAVDVPLVVFTRPAHPLLARTHTGRARPVRHDELAGYPMFVSDAAGDFHALLRRYFDADGSPGPALEAAGTVEGVKQGVATDPRALGILPAYALAAELAAARVAAVPLRTPPPRMTLEAIAPSAGPRHPSLNALLDALLDPLPGTVRGAAGVQARDDRPRPSATE